MTHAVKTIDREGKYRIGPRLGAGGMAEVFLGWTVGANGFSRAVVLKRILPAWSANEQFSAMFINEAHLASLLHHPNIVGMHLLDRDAEGCLYQVLEYVEGRDLEKLTSVGPIPVPIAIYVIASVLRGLDHAHSARNPSTGRPLGIVHRDCTPSNVLIDYAGNVKVSDFGVAKAVYATNATRSGTAKGKPGYMSPEQLKGAALDGRSDLFAVGVMLWELLAGLRLFAGETLEAVITQVLEYANGAVQIPDIAAINPAVPPELGGFVHDLLLADRNKRPASAAAALARLRTLIPADGAEQLAQLLATRFPRQPATEPPSAASAVQPPTVQARPGSTPQPAGTPMGLGQIAAAATGFSPAPAQPRRSRWLGLGLAASGVAAIGVSIGVALSGGSGNDNSPTAAPAEPITPRATAPVEPIPSGQIIGLIDAPEAAIVHVAAANDTNAAVGIAADAGTATIEAVDAGARKRGGSSRPRVDAGTRSKIIEINLDEGGK